MSLSVVPMSDLLRYRQFYLSGIAILKNALKSNFCPSNLAYFAKICDFSEV
jgi:hypothetical protein